MSICLLEFQVSRFPWLNEDSAKKHPVAPHRDTAATLTKMRGSEPVIRGRSMKFTVKSLAKLGLLPLLVILSVGSSSAQTDLKKTILEKLTAKVTRLESACAEDIQKYCSTVTPGEGRMIYCMEAHEDKISIRCAFELGEAATSVQTAADALKDAVIACKAEIIGACGKIVRARGESLLVCCRTNRQHQPVALKPFRKSNPWPLNSGGRCPPAPMR